MGGGRRWGLRGLREATQEPASRWPFPLGPERQLWVRRLASGRRTAENFTDEKTHRVKANTALRGAACGGRQVHFVTEFTPQRSAWLTLGSRALCTPAAELGGEGP